jgi:hypothetical protein
MELSQQLSAEIIEIAQQQDVEKAIQKILKEYIELKLAYWQTVNLRFENEVGMDYKVYENTQATIYDGADFSAQQFFWNWTDAVAMIEFYQRKLHNGFTGV